MGYTNDLRHRSVGLQAFAQKNRINLCGIRELDVCARKYKRFQIFLILTIISTTVMLENLINNLTLYNFMIYVQKKR